MSFTHTKACFLIKRKKKSHVNILVKARAKVFRYFSAHEGDFLNRILICLYCSKYNEINIRHSDV